MKSFTRFADFIEPGDLVAWGNAAGEPRTLVESLLADGPGLPGVSIFAALTVSGLLTPETARPFRIVSLGGHGTLSRLAREGQLEIVPANISDMPRLLASRALPVSVALVQVSLPNRHGFCSLGVTTDFTHALISHARVVIAEINARMPRSAGASLVPVSRFTAAIEVDRPLVASAAPTVGEAERAIARHVAALVPDGATIQIGYGAIPQAVLEALAGKNDLGIHSGMITDGVVDLIQRGVITNACKPLDRGKSVTGVALGTERLYEFMDDNPLIEMRDIEYTHSPAVIRQLPDFVAVNSAIEIDLWGQVNAEVAGDLVVGGVGGQLDFVRAARISPGGKSILALPATARNGTVSRLVPQLAGTAVTCTKSEADWVVTEFGAAHLYGVPLGERAERLIAIAHPEFRELLRGALRAPRPGRGP